MKVWNSGVSEEKLKLDFHARSNAEESENLCFKNSLDVTVNSPIIPKYTAATFF